MSYNSKSKYEEMHENDPTRSLIISPEQAERLECRYAERGHTRHLCFVQLDRKRIFLNYAYLIAGELEAENNLVILTFTTHSAMLNGINLEPLFYEIMDQLCRQIVCQDARYNALAKINDAIVNSIHLSSLKDYSPAETGL